MTSIPNKRITDVDGHKLEYATAGAGRPAIVFINGGGPADMDSWRKVYPETNRISTVFAYNRFGDGNSDKVNAPQTGANIVATLRELLRGTGLNPPYVLVGHSLGGLYANLFARLHPDEVAGVVLVDSSHPDQGEMMRGASQGVILSVINAVFQKFYAAINPTKYSETTSFDETASQLKKAGPFPDIPLIVITAGKRPSLASEEVIRMIKNHQRSLVAMSAQGKQIIAEKSSHYVQNDQPEIVIQAIHEVVDKSQK